MSNVVDVQLVEKFEEGVLGEVVVCEDIGVAAREGFADYVLVRCVV